MEHDNLYGGLPDKQIKSLEEAAASIDEAASAEILAIKRNIEIQVAQLKQVVAGQEEAKAKAAQEARDRAQAAAASQNAAPSKTASNGPSTGGAGVGVDVGAQAS